MPEYNKLVRDNIPEIIESTGRKPIFKILNNEEYYSELVKKSYEELDELLNAHNKQDAIEELADILELVYAFAEYHGSSIEMIEDVRKLKAENRGTFKKKIYLEMVE
jgi:predicted house-cleaning noncanonical NTP pyrophosphatase (MazG superfamily)